MPQHFRIIGQRPVTVIDNSGALRKMQEITFEWGNNFTGSIEVDSKSATPEAIRSEIEDYIKRFSIGE